MAFAFSRILIAIGVLAAPPPSAEAQQRVGILDGLITFEIPADWSIIDKPVFLLSTESSDDGAWVGCDAVSVPRQVDGIRQEAANEAMQQVPPQATTLPSDEILSYSILDFQGVAIRQLELRSEHTRSYVRQFWLIDGPILHTAQVDCWWDDSEIDSDNELRRTVARSFLDAMTIKTR